MKEKGREEEEKKKRKKRRNVWIYDFEYGCHDDFVWKLSMDHYGLL